MRRGSKVVKRGGCRRRSERCAGFLCQKDKLERTGQNTDRRRKGYAVEERRIDSSPCVYFLWCAGQSSDAAMIPNSESNGFCFRDIWSAAFLTGLTDAHRDNVQLQPLHSDLKPIREQCAPPSALPFYIITQHLSVMLVTLGCLTVPLTWIPHCVLRWRTHCNLFKSVLRIAENHKGQPGKFVQHVTLCGRLKDTQPS